MLHLIVYCFVLSLRMRWKVKLCCITLYFFTQRVFNLRLWNWVFNGKKITEPFLEEIFWKYQDWEIQLSQGDWSSPLKRPTTVCAKKFIVSLEKGHKILSSQRNRTILRKWKHVHLRKSNFISWILLFKWLSWKFWYICFLLLV